MEEKIVVTELDAIRLKNLIICYSNDKKTDTKNLKYLRKEIERAEIIKSKQIASDIVTMNSIVEIYNHHSKKDITIKVVYPMEADYRKGNISILSPLGSALLGYKEGDRVCFDAPGGNVEVHINSITYQPEANGHYQV